MTPTKKRSSERVTGTSISPSLLLLAGGGVLLLTLWLRLYNEQLTPQETVDLANKIIIDTEEEVIALIQSGEIPAEDAVKYYPNNKAVITSAFKKDPASIKHASIETLNALGLAGVITEKDVLAAFSKAKPTEETIKQTTDTFTKAVAQKKWTIVAEMCKNTFWFEKTAIIDKEAIVKQLSSKNEWQDLYKFERAMTAEIYPLTRGPLEKSEETVKLEKLFRKMMTREKFSVQTIGGDDYFVFNDGTQFNWTQIRAESELQHVQLDQADFDTYKQFVRKEPGQYCSLLDVPYYETLYRNELYQHPIDGTPLPIHEPPISMQEMQAINIFTGNFYEVMNGVMRDEQPRFDYRTGDKEKLRSGVVHSVMAASGLRKIPMTEIEQKKLSVAYRGVTYASDEAQLERVQATARQDTFTMEGFISTTLEKKLAYCPYPGAVIFVIHNLRGAYIAPISQHKKEKEYLMSKSTLRGESFHEENGKFIFEASVVTELEKEQAFAPMVRLKKIEVVEEAEQNTTLKNP